MTTVGAAAACRARLRVGGPWLLAASGAALSAAGLALVLVDDPARAPVVGGGFALPGALALAAILVGGWLGSESRSGTALFWAQMPVDPVRVHLVRFGTVVGAALTLAASLAVAIAGLLWAAGSPARALDTLTGIPGILLAALGFCSLVWAVGGWGVAGDGWAGLLLAAALSVLELVAKLRADWLGLLAIPADVLGLPLDDLGLAAAFLSGRAAGSALACLRVLAWIAGWVAVGAVGVHVTCRSVTLPDPAG